MGLHCRDAARIIGQDPWFSSNKHSRECRVEGSVGRRHRSPSAHARAWCDEFFDWYANVHRHSGLAFFTPADVFFGRVDELSAVRQQALDAAYAAHPERFTAGPPKVSLPPERVVINPIVPEEMTSGEEDKIV